MPSDFQLAAYLYRIENTYPDFAALQKSAARISVLALSGVMVELEVEAQTQYDSTVLPTYSVAATPSRSRDRENRFIRSCRRSSYANRQGKSLEVCSHCHLQWHNKLNYWKKYSERSPNFQKKEE